MPMTSIRKQQTKPIFLLLLLLLSSFSAGLLLFSATTRSKVICHVPHQPGTSSTAGIDPRLDGGQPFSSCFIWKVLVEGGGFCSSSSIILVLLLLFRSAFFYFF
jgi:hypothetical protein